MGDKDREAVMVGWARIPDEITRRFEKALRDSKTRVIIKPFPGVSISRIAFVEDPIFELNPPKNESTD